MFSRSQVMDELIGWVALVVVGLLLGGWAFLALVDPEALYRDNPR